MLSAARRIQRDRETEKTPAEADSQDRATAQEVHGEQLSLPLLKLSLSFSHHLTVHFASLLLEKAHETHSTVHSAFSPHAGTVSARTTHTTMVSQLSACWVFPTTQTCKKGMNKCHGNFKKLLDPDRQGL